MIFGKKSHITSAAAEKSAATARYNAAFYVKFLENMQFSG